MIIQRFPAYREGPRIPTVINYDVIKQVTNVTDPILQHLYIHFLKKYEICFGKPGLGHFIYEQLCTISK